MSRTRRIWGLGALLLVLALLASACGDSDDPAIDAGQGDDDATTTTELTVDAPDFEAGTTMAELQEEGKLVVGTKFDQPGFGLKTPSGIEGFDVEIAKLIAQRIFGGTLAEAEDKIEFVEAVSKNREPFIQDGTVDIVVATYTINDTRKEVVDFAGPYFVARQDILVKADNDEIESVEDLNGKKVCSVKGSTSEKNLAAKAPQAEAVLFDSYSLCVEALNDGRVEAVTTDNIILQGFVNTSNGDLKLVKAPFSDEPYGIGLSKGDDAFRDFINDVLEEIFDNGQWETAFEATLGPQGLGLDVPEPPEVDRY